MIIREIKIKLQSISPKPKVDSYQILFKNFADLQKVYKYKDVNIFKSLVQPISMDKIRHLIGVLAYKSHLINS